MISGVFKLSLFFLYGTICVSRAQDYEGEKRPPPVSPPAQDNCNGIYVDYTFISRTRVYPYIKNATAQPWAFKAIATVLNAGMYELKNWQIFIGFQHQEILVSATNAILVQGDDFPAPVGNGTYLSGYPQTDLKTSIQTAGDLTQIQAQVELSGTQFGIRPPGYPMPRTIRLANDGYRCPLPIRQSTMMYLCCVRDPRFKGSNLTTKYFPRQNGDLLISYDVMQAYDSSYLAQVTLENANPLGRLDQWNLTWEWMRGEFIYTMRGAYTRKKDVSECVYGAAGDYYRQLDFSEVMNCEKHPVISDLPPDRAEDKDIGRLPYCCRNGSLMPTVMNETHAKSVFQLQVYKLPPDLNRTALYPPQQWKIFGILNPQYRCGQPLRVDEAEFPDPSGLEAVTSAVASWQIVCNITRPKSRENRCCVSYSAYYNDSSIPCNTCACGCDNKKCNQNAPALLLPPDALLVPFENRTLKAVHWNRIMNHHVPTPLPCGDNCAVSINWHLATNHMGGWTARITLFNWEEINFEDWFIAIQFHKTGAGFQRAYSFNGSLLEDLNDTIFLQGLPGLNYLIGETNGTNPEKDPKVPGKQQSVLSFTKKGIHNIDIAKGDGFPSKLIFNGEECALPTQLLIAHGITQYRGIKLVVISISLVTIFLITDQLH